MSFATRWDRRERFSLRFADPALERAYLVDTTDPARRLPTSAPPGSVVLGERSDDLVRGIANPVAVVEPAAPGSPP